MATDLDPPDAPALPPAAADRPRSGPVWWLAGIAVLAVAALPIVQKYLVRMPHETWQVDLQVYRESARALVTGFPPYLLRTDQPQFLPFTYPPFAAITALPLLLAPFRLVGYLWTALQYALLWYTVGVAFRPFLDRFGHRRPLVQGMVAAAGAWLLPVSEGIRFGQVNAVIVALCLWDVTRRRDGAWRGGSGIGVGLATAVKLTPGVFWLHWAACRRWRPLAVSAGTAAGVTLLAALIQPGTSATYWTGALRDPERLGPNDVTSNQSLRGVLLRVGPPSPVLSGLLWLLLAGLVLVAGLTLSRRFDALGEPVAVVATVGLVAFLVSPVSWIHHFHWVVVVLGALLGDGRQPRRVVPVAVATALLWLKLPWTGGGMVHDPHWPLWFARIVESSLTEMALLALLALWLLVARPAGAAR